MSRAGLCFRLPQEREEFEAAAHGMDWRIVCQELDEILRQFLKYGFPPHLTTPGDVAESVRAELRSRIEGMGLNLYE